jgi:Ca2+-binding EF-hand superfamily protein
MSLPHEGGRPPTPPETSSADNDELAQTFKEFDQDGDGYITAVEFKLAMTARREQISGDEIDSIWEHADADHDGKINLAEFTIAWNT